jgi:hypothetical protein
MAIWVVCAGRVGRIKFRVLVVSILVKTGRHKLVEREHATKRASQCETLKDQVMKRGIQALALIGFTVAMSVGCTPLRNRQCNNCNGSIGCRPCNIGWQRGGSDYGAHLTGNHFGGRLGAHHGNAMSHNQYRQDPQVGSGAPAPQTAYPYYTNRGPRDFFASNPPSIGR